MSSTKPPAGPALRCSPLARVAARTLSGSLIDDLARRNVDGIVAVSSMTRADVPGLRDPGLPLLFLNCPFPVPGYRTIGPNALDGSRRSLTIF